MEREYYVNDGGSRCCPVYETLYVRYMNALGHKVPLPDEGYVANTWLTTRPRSFRNMGASLPICPVTSALRTLGPMRRWLGPIDGTGAHGCPL